MNAAEREFLAEFAAGPVTYTQAPQTVTQAMFVMLVALCQRGYLAMSGDEVNPCFTITPQGRRALLTVHDGGTAA